MQMFEVNPSEIDRIMTLPAIDYLHESIERTRARCYEIRGATR